MYLDGLVGADAGLGVEAEQHLQEVQDGVIHQRVPECDQRPQQLLDAVAVSVRCRLHQVGVPEGEDNLSGVWQKRDRVHQDETKNSRPSPSQWTKEREMLR